MVFPMQVYELSKKLLKLFQQKCRIDRYVNLNQKGIMNLFQVPIIMDFKVNNKCQMQCVFFVINNYIAVSTLMENIPQQIDLVLEGVGAIGRVYIGNYSAACNSKTLRKYNIRAVITAATGLMLPHPKQILPNYLYLPIDDVLEQQLVTFFNPTFEFFEKNRVRTNILIHCFSGISRSAALLMAYMIRKYGYTVMEALTLCKKCKKRINPNKSFIRQLVKYHREFQTDRSRACKTERDPQVDRRKGDDLSNQLLTIKKNSENIEMKIREAKQKLIQNESCKNRKSQYIRNILAEVKSNRTKSHCSNSDSNDQSLDIKRFKMRLNSIHSSVS